MHDLLVYGGLAVVVAAGLFALATWLLPAGEQIAPPVRDDPLWTLPDDRRLEGQDVDAVKLPVALRGYRFAETDQLLDRLAAELRERDEIIARLRAHEPADGADGAVAFDGAEAERTAEPQHTPGDDDVD
ncbi:MAG: hypothetical protein ACTHMS_13840 [Jatrophihabitans sp.]|uniref:hypothetical protein n=1 Tax=Jatrophihabitans sp. TaxID=1932789 RepID=UPI003F81E47D